jgi:hypothetical protein
MAQEDFYRWHEYMFPPDVYQEARRRFVELVTTSRFSVEETPCLFDLEQVNPATDKITNRHTVSLAVLVCIQFALEELKPLEILNAQGDIKAIVHQIEQARSLQEQADLWLAHLATLDAAHRETVFERTIEKRKRSMQAKQAAQNLRKNPTVKQVASHFNERPGQKWESVIDEFREATKTDSGEYTVSESTIARRYREAKKKNLLS